MPKSKNSLIGALLIVGIVGGVLVGAYVVSSPDAQRVPDDLRRRGTASGQRIADKVQTLVPRMDAQRNLGFDKHTVDVPRGADPMVFAVNEYLKASKISNAGARCIGADVKGGVAYLSFTPSFTETQGSDDESILVNGILATMSQFPDVQKVQFEVEGKPVVSLGHFDLSSPQPVVRLQDN